MNNPSIVNHFTMGEGRQVVIEFDRAVTADEFDGIVALVKGGATAAPSVPQPTIAPSLTAHIEAVDLASAHLDDAAFALSTAIKDLKQQVNGSAAQSPG